MLTLTLRGADGRFLARIVEQNANVFVLDFGDQRVIDDATQRIHRGFTVFRAGQLVKAAPRSRDLLVLLADYYAGEGMLVSLEEPLWPGRTRSLEDMLAERGDDPSLVEVSMSMLPDFDEETQDLPTDVWGRDEAERVKELIGESRERAVRATWSPPTRDEPEVPERPERRAPPALDHSVPLDELLDDLLDDSFEDMPTVEVERSPDGPPTLVDRGNPKRKDSE